MTANAAPAGAVSRLSAGLGRLDRLVYRGERALVGALMLVMGGAVFFDVVHRVFSRSPGRIAVLLSGPLGISADQIDARYTPALLWLATLGISYFAVDAFAMARGKGLSRKRCALFAAAGTLVLALLIQGFVHFLPEGIVWAPYLSLCILLWTGLIGASMTTYHGRHLALEMGEKLWPKRVRPAVQRLALLAAGAFCAMLAALAAMSMSAHLAIWMDTPEADLIPSLDAPKWMVFSVIPYAFFMMALRFFGRALGLLEGPAPAP